MSQVDVQIKPPQKSVRNHIAADSGATKKTTLRPMIHQGPDAAVIKVRHGNQTGFSAQCITFQWMFQHHPETRFVQWLFVFPLHLSSLACISGRSADAAPLLWQLWNISHQPHSAQPDPARGVVVAARCLQVAEETLSTQLPNLRGGLLPPRHHRSAFFKQHVVEMRDLRWNHGLCSLRLQAARCCGSTGRSWRGWGWCRKRYGRSCCSRCCSFRCRRRDATCSSSAGVTVRLLLFSLLIERCFDSDKDLILRVSWLSMMDAGTAMQSIIKPLIK